MTNLQTRNNATWEDLWDQHDQLANHTSRGIDFLDRYSSFVKEKYQADLEYAKSIRAIVKKYQPTSGRRNCEIDEPQFSTVKAFMAILNEFNYVAGQHEMIADSLKTEVISEITKQVKSLKDSRKANLDEIKRLEGILAHSINTLLQLEKEYARSWKDAQSAKDKYQKADEDMNLSRADVMKAKEYSEKKIRDLDNAKANYAYQLKATNDLKDSHYSDQLPCALNKLREVDEARIMLTKAVYSKHITIENQSLPLISKCFEVMKSSTEQIDPNNDSGLVVEHLRSGHLPPTDFIFKDMGDPASAGGNESIDGANDGRVKRKVKDTLKRGKSGRNSIGSIFPVSRSSAPQQRCRKLQKRLKELETELKRAIAKKDGVRKLHDVYAKDPRMGNANTVEYEEQGLEKEIQNIQGQIAALRLELDQAMAEVNVPINQAVSSSNSAHTTPNPSEARLAPESARNHNSDTAPSNNHSLFNNVHLHNNDSGTRGSFTSESSMDRDGVPSGRSPSEVSGRSSGQFGSDAERIPPMDDVDDYTLPAESLGTCKVLYDFQGTNEGTVSVSEGETVDWLERDEGDGWTRVRKENTMGEGGFVPTSYLQFFPN